MKTSLDEKFSIMKHFLNLNHRIQTIKLLKNVNKDLL